MKISNCINGQLGSLMPKASLLTKKKPVKPKEMLCNTNCNKR